MKWTLAVGFLLAAVVSCNPGSSVDVDVENPVKVETVTVFVDHYWWCFRFERYDQPPHWECVESRDSVPPDEFP